MLCPHCNCLPMLQNTYCHILQMCTWKYALLNWIQNYYRIHTHSHCCRNDSHCHHFCHYHSHSHCCHFCSLDSAVVEQYFFLFSCVSLKCNASSVCSWFQIANHNCDNSLQLQTNLVPIVTRMRREIFLINTWLINYSSWPAGLLVSGDAW